MSITDVENEEELNREMDLLEERIEQEKKSDRSKQIISWTTSFVLHSCFLLLASALYYVSTESEIDELPPTKISVIIPTPPPFEKKENSSVDIVERIVLVESDDFDPDAKVPISSLQLPEDEVSSSEDDLQNNTRLGREEAVGEMEMGANAFFNNIGAGSNAGGMFGNRHGGGDKRARQKMGPMGKSASSATDSGLRWLMRHQSPNGSWEGDRYFLNCTLAIKCEPGSLEGRPAEQINVAMTGYAIGCFLGVGYDHKTPSKYRKVVGEAVKYLLAVQKPNGMLGERNYEHAIATMALVEAYGMSQDNELKEPSQRAVNALISKQTIENPADPYSGLLWDYTKPNMARNDMSVVGWNIMALKSAAGAGLDIKESLNSSKLAVERVWKAANPDWEKKTDPYNDITIFPYTWNPSNNTTAKEHLSFVGSTCAVFLGHGAGDIMLETLLNDAEKRWIDSGAFKKNTYASYYLSLSMFQAGGERWKKCLDTIIPYAIETQDKSEGCANGSWDWKGQSWHGSTIGRVLSTCYNILNLEVAYRYVQVNKDVNIKEKIKGALK